MPLPTVVHPHSKIGLDSVGFEVIEGFTLVHWNLNPAEIYEHALNLHEGNLTRSGALRVLTGEYTGRSPKDKFFVEEPSSRDKIWWGPVNQGVSQELFDRMQQRAVFHLEQRQHIFVQDLTFHRHNDRLSPSVHGARVVPEILVLGVGSFLST
jgi:phosphoenolpyruvate carboxykinase (ATP)